MTSEGRSSHYYYGPDRTHTDTDQPDKTPKHPSATPTRVPYRLWWDDQIGGWHVQFETEHGIYERHCRDTSVAYDSAAAIFVEGFRRFLHEGRERSISRILEIE